MPRYVKFIKELLSNKHKLKEASIVALGKIVWQFSRISYHKRLSTTVGWWLNVNLVTHLWRRLSLILG